MLLAVVGATGKQGSGVIVAALHSAEISVRAIVRDQGRPLERGVTEVVVADLDDVDSLSAAFAGADAAYCVTPPDEPGDWGRETVRARNMATAARNVKLAHVVWSTQEDTRENLDVAGSTVSLLGGRYRVPSYDAKAEADAAFRRLGVPTTFMRTSFYWESLFVPGISPANGVLRWPLGDAKLPGIAVADIGRCAVSILRRRSEFVDRTIGICGDVLTGYEIADAIRDVAGLACRYEPIEPSCFPVNEGTVNMFVYKRDCEHAHREVRDVALSRDLNPQLQTFRQWLAREETGRRLLAL
jgi:uncharacterized protein YbjT (DUF2867 family)